MTALPESAHVADDATPDEETKEELRLLAIELMKFGYKAKLRSVPFFGQTAVRKWEAILLSDPRLLSAWEPVEDGPVGSGSTPVNAVADLLRSVVNSDEGDTYSDELNEVLMAEVGE